MADIAERQAELPAAELPAVDHPAANFNAQVQAALSADIHLLGDLLGANIRRLAGPEAFALEEEVRAAAKALRAGPSVEEARALRDRLDRLDQAELLERSPVLRHSIQQRNPYVDPLSFIQLVLLRRLRAGGEPQEDLLTTVLESVNGIAAGLKNTG